MSTAININTAPTALLKAIAHQLPSGKPVEAQAADPQQMARTSQGVAAEHQRSLPNALGGSAPQLTPPRAENLSNQDLTRLIALGTQFLASTQTHPGQQVLNEIEGLAGDIAQRAADALLDKVDPDSLGKLDSQGLQTLLEDQVKSDPKFALLVALMIMFMLMGEHDRDMSAQMKKLSEQATAAAGDHGISGAKARLTGAIVGLTMAAVAGVAGIGMSARAAQLNVTSTGKNMGGSNVTKEVAGKSGTHMATGTAQAKPKNDPGNIDQRNTMTDNGKPSQGQQSDASHFSTGTRASIYQAGGHAAQSAVNPMNGVSSGAAEVQAAEQEAAKQRQLDYANTDQNLAAQENEQANKQLDLMRQFMAILEDLRQKRSDVLGAISQRLG